MSRSGRGNRSAWSRTVDTYAPALCWAAVGTLIAVCFTVIVYLLWQGVPALNWQLLTTDPLPSLTESLSGGVRAPIGGTIILLLVGTFLVTLPAIATATYLAEYMREEWWLTKGVRFGLEMLASVPSVVFGMWGIAFFTLPQFIFLSSAAADPHKAFGRSFMVGAVVLTVHILPFVIKVMEEAIRSVPRSYRQAAAALGMPKWATTAKIILPAAAPGITTAIILGMGLIAGDTAIVQLCVGGNMVMTGADQWWLPMNWLKTILGQGSTLTTFTYYSSPAGDGNSPTKAFAAAFVLILIVLALNLLVEWIMRRKRAASE
jgi:phosphate transport system permease protein